MAPFELNNQACLTGLCGWIANNLTGEGSTLRKIGKKVFFLSYTPQIVPVTGRAAFSTCHVVLSLIPFLAASPVTPSLEASLEGWAGRSEVNRTAN